MCRDCLCFRNKIPGYVRLVSYDTVNIVINTKMSEKSTRIILFAYDNFRYNYLDLLYCWSNKSNEKSR